MPRKKKPLFDLRIYKRTDKQTLLNIDEDGKKDLFAAAGLSNDSMLGPKAGQTLEVLVRYDGQEFNLNQKDTHGYWASHQEGVGETFLDKVRKKLKIGQHVEVGVVSVKVVSASAGKPVSVKL